MHRLILQSGTAMPRLLAALPPDDLDRLLRDLDHVHLPAGRLLTTAHDPPRRVYFPDTAVVALSLAMHDGRTAGVGMTGFEGMIGLSAMGGPTVVAGTESAVQIGGTAWTMSAERFRTAVRVSEPLRSGLERYASALLGHWAQTVVCNRLHGLDERAARWLLLIHDRIEDTSFRLTQEAFADLLGVSRPAVSTVGAQFARAGAAEFRRGVVRIHDPAALEGASCECIVADREAFRPISHHVAAGHPERSAGERTLGILRPQIRRAR
ncbi:MAG TPA: Crp/Fnr family transcriptional regulator [Candidatus Acidoferrales bacterium]|jgi:CRP-like cAMP-binding protein|nr:Crp/Fnr family transcriptional regulator [Candidatus Acidoferrales bacterium]